MRQPVIGLIQDFLRKLKPSIFDIRVTTRPSIMSTEIDANELKAATKRHIDDSSVEATDDQVEAKKAKLEANDAKTENAKVEPCMGYTRPFYMKRKVAMLLLYSGKGYTGMQMNPGMKTIEQDLMEALLKAGVVTEDHITKPGVKMGFQRAARTDKGVSAAGQLVSLKMFVDVENAVEKINAHLVDQIRVLAFKRVTRGFSSKDTCSSRTYIYLIPTFAFTPVEEFVTDNFKMSASLRDEVNRVLAFYKGTHKFHNFTSGKKASDPSAQRYIMEMKIGEPFMKGHVEFAVISVKGQSFMLHQIRKMIGLAIAIVRGLASDKSIECAWKPERADVPMAPSLGLMLDQLHFDAYNKRFGSDGQHEPILWNEFKEEIDAFKEKHIYSTIIETELKERSMMKWLTTLHNHTFETRESLQRECSLGAAAAQIHILNRELADNKTASCELDATAMPTGAKVDVIEGAATTDTHTNNAEDLNTNNIIQNSTNETSTDGKTTAQMECPADNR